MTKRRTPGGEYLFDARLLPHRSLTPLGFWLLMAAIAALSFAAGLFFMSAGAWPILGFYLLDVALMYWAFRASYRSGRMYETVRLTRKLLTVERVSARGRVRRWSFQPYWLRVEIDDPPAHHSQLTLSSHGRSLAIGAFLAPDERYTLAEALRAALGRVRTAAAP